MNIIYGSIVLFLALLPGIVFRKSYLASEFSRKLISEKVIDDIIWAVVPGVIIHSLSFIIVPYISNYEFDLELIGNFISGNNNEKVLSDIYKNIQCYYKEISAYYLLMCIIAFNGGHFSRVLVRLFKWDIKFKQFRFTNRWYYILSGESLMFPNQKIMWDISEKDYMSIDVLSKTSSGHNILYKGILYNYHLTNDGGLESIVLQWPRRRYLYDENIMLEEKSKRKTKKRKTIRFKYTEIPSTKLIIPFENIENINLRLIQITVK